MTATFLRGALDAPDVLRVELRGADLHARFGSDPEHHWRSWTGSAWEACPPERDRRLPLASHLGELGPAASRRLLAHRPGRRLVVRVEGQGTARVFKGMRPRRVSEMGRRHDLAAQRLAGSPLRAPRLLEVDAERAALVFSAAAGGPLALDVAATGRLAEVGRGLRALQSGAVPDDLPRHDHAAELAVIESFLERVEALGWEPHEAWHRLRLELRRRAPALPVVGLRLAHRDLHDGQFLDGPQGLVLLDFDLLCLADPLLDVGNLLAHLELRALQGVHGADGLGVATGGAALLEGLAAHDAEGARARLAWYRAASLARLALVYRLRPPWAHLERPLVAAGLRCLNGR